VTCWRQLADNVAASLARGDRALVCGRLRQRSFETSEGERRVAYEIDADAVGAELTWHAARSQRFARRSAATETPPPDEVDLPDGGPLADPQDEPGEESVESGEEVIREPEPALSQAADIGPLSRVLAGEAPIGVASLHRPQDRRFQDTAPLPAAPAGGAAPFGPPATAPYGPAAAAGLTGAEVGAPAWRSVTTVTGQF
jgi:single-strand DNA-binding protein